MCIRDSEIINTANLDPFAFYFGEEQSRYIITTVHPEKLLKMAQKADISANIIGKTTSNGQLLLPDNCSVPLEELYIKYDRWLPDYMLGA